MKASLQFLMPEERQRRIEKALFRGGELTLDNPAYRRVVRALLDALLVPDLAPRDLTVAALGIKSRGGVAHVLAREPGVAAGLEEYAYLLGQHSVKVTLKKEDGRVPDRRRAAARRRRREQALESGARGAEFIATHVRDRDGHAAFAGTGAAAVPCNANRGHAENSLGAAGQARHTSGRRRHAPAGPGRRHRGEE